MNKGLIPTLIIGFIIVVAAITNPDNSSHKSEIKDLLYSSANLEEDLLNSKNSASGWEMAGTALGYSLGTSLIDKMVDTMVKVDNYVIFSIAKVRYDGKEKAVGYGLFGNVFIYGDLKKNLEDSNNPAIDTFQDDIHESLKEENIRKVLGNN